MNIPYNEILNDSYDSLKESFIAANDATLESENSKYNDNRKFDNLDEILNDRVNIG